MYFFLSQLFTLLIIVPYSKSSAQDAHSFNHLLPGSCTAQPCLHGVCTDIATGGHRCFCQSGYTGLSCQTNYDDCRSKPCMNGGTCIDGIDGFTCICDQGYTGSVCETDINECLSDPCLNDGICEDLLNDYFCHCPLGFSGINCEMYFNICATEGKLCKNDGICVLGPGNTSSCSCAPNFYGEYCEISSCPCVRGGMCIGDTNFGCLCPYGYTGKACETKVETCDSSICNGGLCLLDMTANATDATVCFCVPDFHGKFCEDQYNECVPETCQNGATCMDDVDGYSCICPVGFIGSTCNETYFCDQESCQSSKSQPPYIFPSYFISYSAASEYSPPYIALYSTFSSAVIYSIHSSHFDTNPFSAKVEIFTSPSVPEEIALNMTERTVLFPSDEKHDSFLSTSYQPEMHVYSEELTTSRNLLANITASPKSFMFTKDSSTVQENSCQALHCQNGGTPSFAEDYQCKCLCPLVFAGPVCERETYLMIPQFHQSSYLKHSLPAIDPERGLDMDITFKILSPDGIIFFTDAPDSGAFLLLLVESGVLKLRFSCGQQTTVFMGTHNLLNTSFFTTVSVILSWTRDVPAIQNASCSVKLLVNGSSPMSGQQFLLYPQFTFHRLFIGGFPSHMKTNVPKIHDIPWFAGCVISLQVNGQEKELVQDAEAGVGITECYSSACYRSPCLNGATCKSYDDHWNCECPAGYAGPFCEHKTCFANPCKYGSTCLPDVHLGYLCVCPYAKHGKNCELDLEISSPSFYGNILGYSSYVQYQLLADYHYHLEMRFMFSTPDLLQKSLLLFNGQIDSAYLVHDFLAVALHSGHLFAIFNLGSGTRILKTTSILSRTLAVHTVLIGRHRRYCWMEVDSLPKVVALASGKLTALNTPSALYLGGHSSYNFSLLPEELSAYKGFEGCSFGIEFRTSPGAVFRPLEPIVEGRNIQQCSTTECQLRQCANGGTCIDVGSTFRCECVEGWSGTLCTQRTTPCSQGNHNCQSASTCIPLKDGYRCNCPLGRSGTFCEKNISVSDPMFDGVSSFLSTRMVNIRHSMDIVLSIKPLSSEGLLFYAAQHLNELSRDFISLSLASGFVQLRFNLGTDPSSTVILNSFKRVENNTWQSIEFGRYKRVAYLKLEEDEEVTSISPPGMEMLDIGTRFFLGGVPDLSALPKPASETVPTYFKGCIRFFSVNSRHMDLNSDESLTGLNIEDCDGTFCGFHTCKNGGTCIPKEDGFLCQCSQFFRGDTCDVPIECWQHKCLHGSSCMPQATAGYKCICSIGWVGDHCEKGIWMSSAFFSGKSNLLIKDPSYKYWNLTRTNISFMYLTHESSALLMWTGKVSSEEGDFLGIGLNANRLHLVWSLGWLSRNEIITEPIYGRDQVWHKVHIERSDKTLFLHVDDDSYTSTVAGTFHELNTDGEYYFGGFPHDLDMEDKSLGYFSQAFVGCMKGFSVAGKTVDIMNIKTGTNLAACTQG